MRFSLRVLFTALTFASILMGWWQDHYKQLSIRSHLEWDIEQARKDAKYWKALSDYDHREYKSLWFTRYLQK